MIPIYMFFIETNSQKVKRIKEDGSMEQILSSKIQVGDLLFITEETLFPADVILLESSADGVAFIQTSSLDGEKNLKKRAKPKDFKLKLPEGEVKDNPQRFSTFVSQCDCDDPNQELYEFNGNLKIESKNYPLSANQLLLKGSLLKNTQWIVGFVVYTGNQTKLMMNSKSGGFKLSKVEKKMNKLVIFILLIQIMICLLIAVVGIVTYTSTKEEDSYLHIIDNVGRNFT